MYVCPTVSELRFYDVVILVKILFKKNVSCEVLQRMRVWVCEVVCWCVCHE